MRILRMLIGVILVMLFCSLPAHAQFGSITGPAFPATVSCPPAQFRVITVSGSEGTFLPSSFMQYDEAVALGSVSPSHPLFMSYDQAIEKGLADQNARAQSPAEAARQYRAERRHRAEAETKRDTAAATSNL